MEAQQTQLVQQGIKKEGFHITVTQMCITAVFMALTCVATMVVQIPIPLGYAHLGDSVILICAFFFGPVVGALAGGIGSAMADILTGFAVWAVPTLIIKTIMPIIACAIFGNMKSKFDRCKVISVKGIVGAVVTLLFMTLGYVVFGAIIAGSFAAGLASAPGLLLKSVVNMVVYLFVATGMSVLRDECATRHENSTLDDVKFRMLVMKMEKESDEELAEKSADSKNMNRSDLSARHKQILTNMDIGVEYSTEQIAEKIGLKGPRTRQLLNELVNKELLACVGTTKRRYIKTVD